jgi:hypothetical protein
VLTESLDSKNNKKGKKCTYCNKPNYEEFTCMKKQIDLMTGNSTEQPWKLHSRGIQEEEGIRSCS